MKLLLCTILCEHMLNASSYSAQNEKELKRERRKQSNRESARRSRLRKQVEWDFKKSSLYLSFFSFPPVNLFEAYKFSWCCYQAETEELSRKVESLTAENVAIRSEIGRLSENSEKLKHENATLMVCCPL